MRQVLASLALAVACIAHLAGARAFTATTDNVSTSSDTSADLHTQFTICAWVMPTTTPTTNGFIVIHGANAATSPNAEWYMNVPTNSTVSVNIGTFGSTASTGTITTNAWTDICAVWTGTNASVYIAGSQSGAGAAISGTITHLSNLTEYGASSVSFWSGFHFVGRIADAGIWNVGDTTIPARFHARVAPRLIRAAVLKSWRPLYGQSPEPDLFNPFAATVTGTTIAPGPTVVR